MRYKGWDIVWEIRDHYNDEDDNTGEHIAYYDNADEAALRAMTHSHAPMISVEMRILRHDQYKKARVVHENG